MKKESLNCNKVSFGLFLEVGQVCKLLIKLTPKDYITDLTFLPEIIKEAAGAVADVAIQHNSVNLISDINKQALK
jgi:hypothetical protein